MSEFLLTCLAGGVIGAVLGLALLSLSKIPAEKELKQCNCICRQEAAQ